VVQNARLAFGPAPLVIPAALAPVEGPGAVRRLGSATGARAARLGSATGAQAARLGSATGAQAARLGSATGAQAARLGSATGARAVTVGRALRGALPRRKDGKKDAESGRGESSTPRAIEAPKGGAAPTNTPGHQIRSEPETEGRDDDRAVG
jgi:hypothetical protein